MVIRRSTTHRNQLNRHNYGSYIINFNIISIYFLQEIYDADYYVLFFIHGKVKDIPITGGGGP
jgi:hypothetical protein